MKKMLIYKTPEASFEIRICTPSECNKFYKNLRAHSKKHPLEYIKPYMMKSIDNEGDDE